MGCWSGESDGCSDAPLDVLRTFLVSQLSLTFPLLDPSLLVFISGSLLLLPSLVPSSFRSWTISFVLASFNGLYGFPFKNRQPLCLSTGFCWTP